MLDIASAGAMEFHMAQNTFFHTIRTSKINLPNTNNCYKK